MRRCNNNGGVSCDNEILGYDCDGYEINEFRILRFPFSADIENWDDEPNIDPRFYCLIKSFDGEVFAISVYDDWHREYIRKFERLNENDDIPVLIKSVSEMSYYEVAFDGITDREWYYDRDRVKLRKQLDDILYARKGFSRKITRK